MKKLTFYLLPFSFILLASCSTTEEKPVIQQPKVVQDPIVQAPVEVLDICDGCVNTKDLKTYFDSINYKKQSKTDKLIINTITRDMFSTDDVDLKKEVFFKSIYPLAYQVNKEIKLEIKAMKKGRNLDRLMKKYRVDNIDDLKVRLNTIPVPIMMAQSAIESAYGTSRFSIEGNALFGQWTTASDGMIPREKPDSKWRVAKFETPLDSARSYALNINTNSSYRNFRKLRADGKDPVHGLDTYSQKGEAYVGIVQSVIRNNDLNNYK